ncbi:phosphofructokinase [Alicyclobacillus contaminans]|uniref:1-phosphofructokinase n=1 Tax=Alicyclobacillus contaminans TaxID=392016 RepID=UPI00040FB714|nr:1-phosphofructokinase [Alicyclobacillus contaminans]GMA49446.1 phosphofructokinase [Alicyclobacillus contaminans]
MNNVEQLGQNRRVVTVTLTPAVDLFLQVDTLQPGTLHRVPGPQQFVGGKGINVAKALHAFGTPVVATGFVGGERGRWIESQLTEAGMAVQFTHTAAETRLNVKIVEQGGRLTELNSASAPPADEEWSSFSKHLRELSKSAAWVAFCGKLPDGCREDWYQTAIVEARSLGVKTLLDSSGRALHQGILAGPDIIKPNHHELEELVGRPLATDADVVDAARAVVHAGVHLVVVSLGARGMLAVAAERAWRIEVPAVEVVSAVGAGDTAVAGLLHALVSGRDVEQALRFAAAAATAAVQTSGTMRPDNAAVMQMMERIRISEWRGVL